MELGATFIEPDLVPTRDGDLVALHTPDLNVTTNVASVFGNDRQWFSPYANRTSWWSFNFTSEELVQSLTLLQRLANARTQLYDHLFRIPTLLDVVKLVNEWNQEDVPQWSIPVSATTVLQESGRTGGEQAAPSSKHPPIGIYAELKDTAWLLHDANIDLVQLFFAHLDEHAQDWKNLWNSRGHACHGNRNGVVPPLVIQSFDATSLQSFRNHYNDHQLSSQVGEPPYVLLVSAPACFSDQFWFDFGNSDINGVNGTGVDLRSLVSGIGPDKLCLLDKERGQAVMDKAHQYGLEIHPWTSRPEFSTLSGNGDGSSSESGSAAASASAIKLDSSMQELAHLFCECRAGGVFAEAVATAVQVAALGCYNWKEGTDTNGTSASGEGGTAGVPATPVVPPTASPASGSGSGVDCPSSSTSAASESSPSSSSSAPQSSSIYVPLLCFALGVAVTLIAVAWWNHRRTQSGSSYQSRRQYRVGTTDEYGNHDLELT
jgi:glycerophosphoryl diester phosphodiesterase